MLPVRRIPAPTGLSNTRNQLFGALEHEFDRFFDDFFTAPTLSRVKTGGYPKMNVAVEGDQWKVRMAVPGVNKDELKVEKLPGSIRVSGQMSEDYRSPDNTDYYVRELSQSRFSREIAIPDYVEGEPDASLKDGILTLSWKHKIPEKTQPKLIEVKSEE